MADSNYDSSTGTISPEGIVVKHFMEQISLLPQTWMAENGFNKQQFNLQIGFLIRHLPDRKMQEKALSTWDSKTKEYKSQSFDAQETAAFAGMDVVTELMQFVYEAFDLINLDVVGPATSKQCRDTAIEIPDIDEDLVAPAQGTEEEIDDSGF